MKANIFQKELQSKEEIIKKYPEKAVEAKKHIAKSGSVGMNLSSLRSDNMLAGRFYVSNVVFEGPIFRAGIAVNDVLMKINEEDVLGKSLDEVNEILQVLPPT